MPHGVVEREEQAAAAGAEVPLLVEEEGDERAERDCEDAEDGEARRSAAGSSGSACSRRQISKKPSATSSSLTARRGLAVRLVHARPQLLGVPLAEARVAQPDGETA